MLIYPNHLGAIGSVELVWARRGTLQTFNNKGFNEKGIKRIGWVCTPNH